MASGRRRRYARAVRVLVAPLLQVELLADAALGAGPGRAGDDQRQRGIRVGGIRAWPSSRRCRSSRRRRTAETPCVGFGEVTSADGT